MDSLSWQTESPLWDLIDRNSKEIPHYDDIALVPGVSVNNMSQKIENRLTHKGNILIFIGNNNF